MYELSMLCYASESMLSFEKNEYIVQEGEELNAILRIDQLHDGFKVIVKALLVDGSFGDGETHRANSLDIFEEPVTFVVEASNQMISIPLHDFVVDDYTVEYRQRFLLEACYKETCANTSVLIEDDDSKFIKELH